MNNLLFILLLIAGCGSDNSTDFNSSVPTQAPPTVIRVNPTGARAGETVTIFGFGFSSEAGSNIITVGGTATTAGSYALIDPATGGEIEQITFTVPTGGTSGNAGIFVTVFDNTSNADIQFTLNP